MGWFVIERPRDAVDTVIDADAGMEVLVERGLAGVVGNHGLLLELDG